MVNSTCSHWLLFQAPSSCSPTAASTCASPLRLNVHRRPDQLHYSITTINYQGRQHDIDFTLTPHYTAANLSFNASQSTLHLDYRRTLLYTERHDARTSGLDPLGVRPAQLGFPLLAPADPPMPIANASFQHLSMDNEGLVVNDDGTYVLTSLPLLYG